MTLLEPILSKIRKLCKSEFSEQSPFRHATASAPRQPARAVPPLLLCRTALAYTLPMLLLFSRDSDFLFSVWAWCGEGRVSP